MRFLHGSAAAHKMQTAMPEIAALRQQRINRQKPVQRLSGSGLGFHSQKSGHRLVDIFQLVIFIRHIQPHRQLVNKIMQLLALHHKYFFHIFGRGNIIQAPIQISFFFDFFDGKRPLKNIAFLKIHRAQADFVPFQIVKNPVIILMKSQRQSHFFRRQIVCGVFQAVKSCLAGVSFRQMFFQKGQNRPGFN